MWSTLIGRGLTLLRCHWSKAFLVLLAPAVLCHKEPASRNQSPQLGALERKIPRLLFALARPSRGVLC